MPDENPTDEGALPRGNPEQPGVRPEATTIRSPSAADSRGTGTDAGAGSQRTVAHYRLLSELGRGGQGVVYLAKDTRLGRRVALKLLAGVAEESPEARLRFEREAELASRLDHPGICTVFETGLDGSTRYMALKLLEGESLAQRIHRARFAGTEGPEFEISSGGDETVAVSETEAEGVAVTGSTASVTRPPSTTREIDAILEIVEKSARALHYAHEQGVIHRDVKPGNIMITEAGEPVLLDFGLARHLDGGAETLTHIGQIAGGTIPYMSPEQLSPHVSNLDGRTDVWSLGITLHQCLCLERPFDRATPRGTMEAIQTAAWPGLHASNHAVSRDLELVVQTSLEKARQDRYATALALAEDLARVRHRQPPVARPIGPVLRSWRWVQRNRTVATFSAAIILILASAVVLTAMKNRELREAERASAESAHRAELLLALHRQRTDLIVLRELERQEREALWPALPPMVPAFEEWLERAGAIVARLPNHRRALESELVGELNARETARTRQELEALVQALDRWRSEEAGTSPLVRVRRRRDQARDAEARTVERHRATWERVIASVSQNLDYRGVSLAPIVGLVPLGADPESGLQEFAVEASGEVPGRDAGTGHLVLSESSAVVLVLVPGGREHFGAQGENADAVHHDPMANEHDGPVYVADVAPLLVSKYETTQGQWLRVLGSNPSALFPGQTRYMGATFTLRHPVDSVDLEACRRFAFRLGLRIPTDTEWEHACRAGTTTIWETGHTPETLQGHANVKGGEWAPYASDYDRKVRDPWPFTAPVGALQANGFGLHDLHGNLMEWVVPTAADRVSQEGREMGGFRGGSWQFDSSRARSAAHDRVFPITTYPCLGFRCVMDLP